MKVFGKIFCLAFVAMVAFASFSFADLSVSETSILPAIVRPGTHGVLSMTITNSDTHEIRSVSAQASGTGGITSDSSTFLGDYKPATSGSVTLPFSVPANANAGIYSLAVKFSWLNSTGTFYKSIYVPITVANPAVFSAEALNRTIFTTGDFNVAIRIKNSGGSAMNTRVLVNSTQFLQTGETPLMIGNIKSGESEEFVLGVTLASNVTSGAYSLPLAITYYDESGVELSTQINPRMEVKRTSANIDLALSGAQSFAPGHEVPLKLTVENNGDQDAYDVRIGIAGSSDLSSLSSSDYDSVLTALGGTYVSVGTIPTGSSKQAILMAGVNDLNAGFYRQYFVIKAKDSNGDSLADELAPIGINVEGLTAVEVFVSSKPAPISTNAQHTLSVLVSNIGTSPIKALIVKISGDEFFELLEAQDEQFIGGLIEDDFSTVQYKVRVKDVAGGIYPLNVTTKFKDSYNRDIETSQIIQLKVNGPDADAQFASLIGLIINLVIVIGIIGAIYWWFKLRKPTGKAKKN